MIQIRRDRVEFWLLYFAMIAAGWVGGLFLALPVFVVMIAVLTNKRRYDDLFLGFILMLVFSDNIPSEQFAGLSFTKQLKNFYILFLAFIVVVDRVYFKTINKLIIKFIPFFIIAVISLHAATAETLSSGIQKTLSYFLLYLTIPTIVEYCYLDKGAIFFKRIVSLLFFVMFVSLLLKYLMPTVAISHGGRLRGIFGNPNGLGTFLIVLTILFTIVRSYYSKLFKPMISLFMYMVILLSIYWTGSRTALIAVVLFLGFYQLFKYSQVVGLLAFLSLAVFFQPLMDIILEGISSAGLAEQARTDSLDKGSGRLIAWDFALHNIQDYYYLGRGFTYDEFLMRSNFDYLSRMGHEGGVHNTYLIIWLNTGLIGLILFFRAFLLNFIQAARLTNYAIPAMLALMLSITFEPWMAASLAPYTSIYLTIFVIISQPQFIDKSQNVEHYAKETKEDLVEKVVPV